MIQPATDQLEAGVPAMLSRRQQLKRDHAERLITASLKEADLAIAFLCRELGMPRTTLCRLFEQDGGVRAYILARRLEAVREALLAGPEDIGLKDLAQIWRFSDASHLSRRFKQRYGWPPMQYRERNAVPEQLPCANISFEERVVSPVASETERVRLLEEENRALKKLIASAGLVRPVAN